jgi:hypothetical protein
LNSLQLVFVETKQHLLKKAVQRKQRRKRIFWTQIEENQLRKGVDEFGVGKWARILNKYPHVFQHRNSVDLKDKWRNISRKSNSAKQAAAAAASAAAATAAAALANEKKLLAITAAAPAVVSAPLPAASLAVPTLTTLIQPAVEKPAAGSLPAGVPVGTPDSLGKLPAAKAAVGTEASAASVSGGENKQIVSKPAASTVAPVTAPTTETAKSPAPAAPMQQSLPTALATATVRNNTNEPEGESLQKKRKLNTDTRPTSRIAAQAPPATHTDATLVKEAPPNAQTNAPLPHT